MARNRTEQLLVGLIAVLTLWGIIMQVMVRSYVRQERSLTSGDEERLAEEIASIESELVQQFSPQQLDVWAAEADEADERGALPGVADAADPNVPNANGEFTVSQTQLAHTASGPDVLLASRLLFPVIDGDWCELKMTRAIAPGSYQLAMTGVLGRWGAQAAAGLLMLQVRTAGDWSLTLSLSLSLSLTLTRCARRETGARCSARRGRAPRTWRRRCGTTSRSRTASTASEY